MRAFYGGNRLFSWHLNYAREHLKPVRETSIVAKTQQVILDAPTERNSDEARPRAPMRMRWPQVSFIPERSDSTSLFHRYYELSEANRQGLPLARKGCASKFLVCATTELGSCDPLFSELPPCFEAPAAYPSTAVSEFLSSMTSAREWRTPPKEGLRRRYCSTPGFRDCIPMRCLPEVSRSRRQFFCGGFH